MTADPNDIIEANPIEILRSASNLSLVGGGAVLAAAILLVAKANDGGSSWNVDNSWVTILIIGAILLGVIAAIARMVDAALRARMTIKLLEINGTTDPKINKKIAKVVSKPLFAFETVNLVDGSTAQILIPHADADSP
jgi:hypothetical protein